MALHIILVTALIFIFKTAFTYRMVPMLGMGPYECIQMLDIRPCEGINEDNIKVSTITKGTNGSTEIFEGSWSSTVAFDENMAGQLTIYKQNGNTWTRVHGFRKKNICKEGSAVYPYMFRLIMESSGEKAQCPIPAGLKKLTNFPACFTTEKYKTMPYGNFKVNIIFEVESRQIGCMEMLIKVEKPSQG